MDQRTEERRRERSLIGSAILGVLISALYIGFVITLFAGFTADIQRDLLSRELGTSSPGSLERVVLQAYHEADLRGNLANVRTEMRRIDARAFQAVSQGLAMRKDAISAWWEAFDSYSRLGQTVVNNRAAFDAAFADAFLQAMNAAYQFVSEQKIAIGGSGQVAPPTSAGNEAVPERQPPQPGMIDIPTGETVPEERRRAEGIRIMARLHQLLENPQFTADATPAFVKEVGQQLDAIRVATMAFDEKSARAQIEWANIHAEQRQAEQLRNSLQTEYDAIQVEIARLGMDPGYESLSLVALFQHPVGRGLSYLIQLPTIMLTLLVTVAAGGLGAVVAFTRQNFRIAPVPEADPDHPVATPEKPVRSPAPDRDDWQAFDDNLASAARLLVMTSEGIAAAMAIFLFTEAGMLMLMQGGPDGSGQIDISPYLVTFTAFVSGFMAEDAFTRIQIAGKKIFRVRADEDERPGADSGPEGGTDSRPGGGPDVL